MSIRAIVFDIEGTVCPISFVKDVLFPFARSKIHDLLDPVSDSEFFQGLSDPQLSKHISEFPDSATASKSAFLNHVDDLMDRDVKASYLKSLQGYLWTSGYESGEIKAPIYPDAVDAIRAWACNPDLSLYIYSSGSVPAQKLLFSHTDASPSDMTGLFKGYFDTVNAGLKTDKSSYVKISEEIQIDPLQILFFTDNPKEIDAALQAGWNTLLAVRPGNAKVDKPEYVRLAVTDFTKVELCKIVRVTLKDHSQLRGKVENIRNGTLDLQDVQYLTGAKHFARQSIQGYDIQDLDILDNAPPNIINEPSKQNISSKKARSKQPHQQSQQHQQQPSCSNEQAFSTIVSTSFSNSPLPFSDPAILQASAALSSSGIRSTSSPRPRRKQQSSFNGEWASEDLTQIKQTDFDFQANLDRFDKALVFNQIREQDTTAPSDRLVAFNKLDSSNSSNNDNDLMKKYSHKEMVLPAKNGFRTLSDSNEYGLVGGRAAVKPAFPSLSSSANSQGLKVGPVQLGPSTVKTVNGQASGISLAASEASHPRIKKFISATTGETCPCIAYSDFAAIITGGLSGFGALAALAPSENIARSAAQIILKNLGGSSRFTIENHNSRPSVIFVFSNLLDKRYVLPIAVHLLNRQIDVTAIATYGDDPSELSIDLKRDLSSLKQCGAKVHYINLSSPDFDNQLQDIVNSLDSPPELIVEAIQGVYGLMDRLWKHSIFDFKPVGMPLFSWLNNQRVPVLSLDVPSGLDPSSGKVHTKYSMIRPKWVISSEFPCSGLLEAYNNPKADISPGDWIHFVVDTGAASRSIEDQLPGLHKIWFGSDWFAEIVPT